MICDNICFYDAEAAFLRGKTIRKEEIADWVKADGIRDEEYLILYAAEVDRIREIAARYSGKGIGYAAKAVWYKEKTIRVEKSVIRVKENADWGTENADRVKEIDNRVDENTVGCGAKAVRYRENAGWSCADSDWGTENAAGVKENVERGFASGLFSIFFAGGVFEMLNLAVVI